MFQEVIKVPADKPALLSVRAEASAVLRVRPEDSTIRVSP